MEQKQQQPSEGAPLEKNYEASKTEIKWRKVWEESSLFKADPHSSKPGYCIVIPPPNVTGQLHMGHALVNTLQDILIRWRRMSGDEVLWVPGTDHAGIATQTVVERHLMATEGKRRTDYAREDFLSRVWRWKEDNESKILGQLKMMGCSCDWSRLRFTMDEGNNRAVKTVFKKLFDEGLITRGDYLVNWDPITQTALADDEVEYEEKQGSLWYFSYPLVGENSSITIATTRPETMLGDTAVAVSPQDERYKHLIGRHLRLPLTDREIPIIADRRIDPQFGTGAVKVTPAHDPNDYQIGLDHGLPFINIMTPDGRIHENGGSFQGMTMQEARQAVVEAMREKDHLVKTEPHTHRVGVSYRSKAVIEPYMSKQWFVKMESFSKTLRALVYEGKTKIIPKGWENTYFHWIDNLRDWCISRQLWWGHQIPIWYLKENREKMICYAGEGLPPEVEEDPEAWERDPDVLDTWFSSALWPFATLGWPEKTPELKKFYPNSVLVTGHDILFFWVARMLMMGEKIMGEPPFPEVFLHGLIYGKSYWSTDARGNVQYVTGEDQTAYDTGAKKIPSNIQSRWEKMSKSKGNVIDPLEIIGDYGADAMRMGLAASPSAQREIDLDRRKFEEFRNFSNKVWNGARFVLMNLQGDLEKGMETLTGDHFAMGLEEKLLTLEDRWILSTLNKVVRDVTLALKNYQFDQAALGAYDFFWKEFCAYYVEIVKPTLFGKRGAPAERRSKQKILLIVLTSSLRLIHPIAPFITEELFAAVKNLLGSWDKKTVPADPYTKEALEALKAPLCCVAPYPHVIRELDIDQTIEDQFALLTQVIYLVRNIRGEMQLAPGVATDIHLVGNTQDSSFKTVADNTGIISSLVRTKDLMLHTTEPELSFASTGMIGQIKVMIPLPVELLEKEKKRLEKEEEKLISSLNRLQVQLENQDFISRAPQDLIAKSLKQKEQIEHQLDDLRIKLRE